MIAVAGQATAPHPRQEHHELDPLLARWAWSGALWLLMSASTAVAVARPRRYGGGRQLIALSPAEVGRVETIAVLSILGGGIVLLLLLIPHFRTDRPGARVGLLLAGLWGAVAVSAVAHGRIPERVGAAALFGAGLLLMPRPSFAWVERVVHRILLVLVVGSVALAVAAPSWATQPGYQRRLPLAPSRLFGLAPHANLLGALAVLLIIIEWRHRRRPPVLLLASLALLWTQSGTAWAALVAVAGFGAATSLRPRRDGERGGLTAALVVLAVLVVSLWLALSDEPADRTDASAGTLTGRTAIWQATLEVWREEPVLGHGPPLWDDRMDRRFQWDVGFAPGHAHNQLMQTLGEAGVVGVGLLVAYLGALIGAARRGRPTAGAAPLALVMVLGIRGLTEVPLHWTISGELLVHLLIAAYVVAAAGTPAGGPR